MSTPSNIARPTRLEGIIAFIEHYVEDSEKVFAALSKKAAERFHTSRIDVPRPFLSFDVDCRVKDTPRGYFERANGDLPDHLERAFEAWFVEVCRLKDQPDVVCRARISDDRRYLTIAVSVEYFSVKVAESAGSTAAR